VRDVDDVVQESFLRIWKARAAHPIASVGAFLFRIARNVALDAVRERRDSPMESVGELGELSVCDEAADVRCAVSHTERMQLLIAAIDSLPMRCREIVILRKFKCVPQKEVAARLGISEKGVEIQVTRGVKRCEEFLRRRGIRSFFGDET
jgi:RNA polymerase sigma-70 factor (ECF subfamily)